MNNNNVMDLINEFDELVTKFNIPFITAKEVDKEIFEKIHDVVVKISVILKDEDSLPKPFIGNLLLMARRLENEAEYFGERSDLVKEMSSRLETLFGIILAGEAYGDRQPGVPRII